MKLTAQTYEMPQKPFCHALSQPRKTQELYDQAQSNVLESGWRPELCFTWQNSLRDKVDPECMFPGPCWRVDASDSLGATGLI